LPHPAGPAGVGIFQVAKNDGCARGRRRRGEGAISRSGRLWRRRRLNGLEGVQRTQRGLFEGAASASRKNSSQQDKEENNGQNGKSNERKHGRIYLFLTGKRSGHNGVGYGAFFPSRDSARSAGRGVPPGSGGILRRGDFNAGFARAGNAIDRVTAGDGGASFEVDVAEALAAVFAKKYLHSLVSRSIIISEQVLAQWVFLKRLRPSARTGGAFFFFVGAAA